MCGMSMVRVAAFSQVPCLTYGMRGMIAASVEVKGPARDLHSGNDGGALHAPPPAFSPLSLASFIAPFAREGPGISPSCIPGSEDVLQESRMGRGAWKGKDAALASAGFYAF